MIKNVVVVGSGLAGSLLANELIKSCRVTVLERGSKANVQFPDVKYGNKVFGGVRTFCYGAGGTTNLWHNGLIPINPEDLTTSYFRDVLADAKPYMDNAASALFLKSKSYTQEYGRVADEVNDLCQKFSTFKDGLDCLIYPKKYHKVTLDPRVQSIYDVQDMNFQYQGGAINAVEYRSAEKQGLVKADCVVVSAGALNSPRIVQQILAQAGWSGDMPGKGFMDHPMGFVGKVRFKKNLSSELRNLSAYDCGDYTAYSAVRLKSDCSRYTSCIFFRQALTMSNHLSIYKYKSLLGASTGLERIRNAFSPKIFHPDILAEIFSHLTGRNLPGRTYNILLIADQKRGPSLVSYDEQGGIRVDWSISDEDIDIYRQLLGKLENMLSPLAEEININTDITEDWLWSCAHHSGTVSMGDAKTDLVDGNLKLKCCDNVYVCDGSVIQEHSYANTGLTIGMLALRLADKIRKTAHAD